MLDRVLGLASAVSLAIGSLAGPADPGSSVDLRFADPAIVESSGLVVDGGLFVTVNDSGDGGRIFVVDGSGQTVGTTWWAGDPVDVEALAPAGPGVVWVGDIGDNGAERDSVEVLRVPYGSGDRTVEPAAYTLVYPDHGHDAETLLAHPRTGQLFVVTKNIFGGTVYAAPRRLSADRPNRLRPVADSLAIATDGAFLPDGRHYLVRDYGSAAVYTFPGHERVATFRLPAQQQGEGLAVAPDGSVHVSTEGQHSAVLHVDLPPVVVTALRPPQRSPSAESSSAEPSRAEPSSAEPSSAEPSRAGSEPAASSGSDRDDAAPRWPWVLGGAVVLGFVGVVARLLTRHGAAS